MKSSLKDSINHYSNIYSIHSNKGKQLNLAMSLVSQNRLEDLARSVIHAKQYIQDWVILRHFKLIMPYVLLISVLISLSIYLELNWLLLITAAYGGIIYSFEYFLDPKNNIEIIRNSLNQIDIISQGNIELVYAILLLISICALLFQFTKEYKSNLFYFAVNSFIILSDFFLLHAFYQYPYEQPHIG